VPTGADGSYRRRDYFRGAALAVGVGIVLVGASMLLSPLLHKSDSVVLLIAEFILGIGVLVAMGAALTLVSYGMIKAKRPPAFADPTLPRRPWMGEDEE
jgi:hypothetical protein